MTLSLFEGTSVEVSSILLMTNIKLAAAKCEATNSR